MKYKEYALPPWIHSYVSAVVAGQEERRKQLDAGAAPDLNNLYRDLNDAVSEGLCAACQAGEANAIFDAIVYRKGYRQYNSFPGSMVYFYKTKRRAVYEIALRLGVAQSKNAEIKKGARY